MCTGVNVNISRKREVCLKGDPCAVGPPAAPSLPTPSAPRRMGARVAYPTRRGSVPARADDDDTLLAAFSPSFLSLPSSRIFAVVALVSVCECVCMKRDKLSSG